MYCPNVWTVAACVQPTLTLTTSSGSSSVVSVSLAPFEGGAAITINAIDGAMAGAAFGQSGTVNIWDPADGRTICSIEASRNAITAAFFASDVWPGFLDRDYNGRKCANAGCHDSGSGRQLVLTGPSVPLSTPLSPEWAAVYRSATEQLSCTNVSSSPLLARPDGRQTHGGQKLIEPDGPEATMVKMWVAAR